MSRGPSFLSPMLRAPGTPHALRNERTGVLIAQSLEAAFDSQTRRKGLLGRTGLPGGTALVIAPCNSIHTFFMRFAIDVVFVKRDGTVARVSRQVPAWRMRLAPRAFAVVELAAGSLDASAVVPGDRLAVQRRDAATGHV